MKKNKEFRRVKFLISLSFLRNSLKKKIVFFFHLDQDLFPLIKIFTNPISNTIFVILSSTNPTTPNRLPTLNILKHPGLKHIFTHIFL